MYKIISSCKKCGLFSSVFNKIKNGVLHKLHKWIYLKCGENTHILPHMACRQALVKFDNTLNTF